jgi:CRISPR/Cas system-associated endonuclease Cas1
MTILLVSCGWLIIGITVGAVIETRHSNRELVEARRDADMWHDQYHHTNELFRKACANTMVWKRRSQAWEAAAKKWHTEAKTAVTRAEAQDVLLAALGAETLKDNPT